VCVSVECSYSTVGILHNKSHLTDSILAEIVNGCNIQNNKFYPVSGCNPVKLRAAKVFNRVVEAMEKEK